MFSSSLSSIYLSLSLSSLPWKHLRFEERWNDTRTLIANHSSLFPLFGLDVSATTLSVKGGIDRPRLKPVAKATDRLFFLSIGDVSASPTGKLIPIESIFFSAYLTASSSSFSFFLSSSSFFLLTLYMELWQYVTWHLFYFITKEERFF